MFVQDGYGPSPPQKTRKHVLPVAGWSGVASLASGRPPSKVVSRQAACCCWSEELAHQLPVSSSWGGSPSSEAPAEPPVTTREQWPVWAGGWMEGQPSLFPAPTSDWDRLLGGLVAPHLPTPSCFPPCRAILSPITGPRKTEGSGNVSGLLLGYRRAGGGDERGPALHRLCLCLFCLGP